MAHAVKIGVFGMIFDEKERILLCHRRDYDMWDIPGGGLKKGEAPWEGVIREVREETGLDVKVTKLQGVYFKPKQNDLVFNFIVNRVGGIIRLNEEADQIEYFSMKHLPENFSHKKLERIKDHLISEKRGVVIMKNQFGSRSKDRFKKTKD